jgi:hypothetical protein
MFHGEILGQDPNVEDITQIVRTLIVHHHYHSHLHIIVELLKPEKATSVLWDDIN